MWQEFKVYLLHHHILTFPNELFLGFDYGLEELQVLYMATVRLYTMHKVLDNFLVDFVTKGGIILEHTANSLSFSNLK